MWEWINKFFFVTIPKNGKILILEEYNQNRTLLQKVLDKKFDVLTTTSKVAAYKIALEDKPDLIVLDSKLHGHKSIDLCINFKNEEQTRNIPILVIADNGSNIAEYFFQGVKGYLIRPFSAKKLLDYVQDFMKNKQVAIDQFGSPKLTHKRYEKVSIYRNTSL